MTVPATDRRAGPYNGNGATVDFGFEFKVYDEADVRVVEATDGVETDATLNSDYTVTLNGDQDADPGGTITYLVAPPTGTTITLDGENLEYSQPTQLPDGGSYRARSVENAIDRVVMLVQQVRGLFNRAIKVPVSDSSSLSTTLPVASERANKVMGFDTDGQPTVYEPDSAVTSSANVTFTPASVNGVARTMQAKERDWVSITDFGAVGDDATDNDDAIRNCFLEAAATGRGILIPPGVYRMAKPLDFLANTTVLSFGTLKITADPTLAGGFLIIKGTDDNIHWVGGTIDGGGLLGITNMNGVAAAFDPTASTTSKNIRFDGLRIVNCRSDLAADAATPFSGGGKGFTLQFHINGAIFSNIVVEDCDIPFSVEAAVSDSKYAENMVISNVVARNCTRGPFFAGSKPNATSSLDDWGYEESKLGQCVLRGIVLDNCGEEGSVYGCITSNYANSIDGEFVIRNSNDSTDKATLWRGNATHSRVKIQAFVDNLNNAIDMTAYTGASNSDLYSVGNEFEVSLHAADSIAGVLWKGDAVLTLRSAVRVAYYHDTVPTLLNGLPASATLKYDFWDMRTGKTIKGSTEISTAPSMASVSRVTYMDQETDFAGAVRLGYTGAGNAYLGPRGTSLEMRDSGDTPRATVSTTGFGVPTMMTFTRSDLTIAAGVITATRSRHRVDTEGAAAADDLDTITAATDGQRLRLYCVSGARVVTVKNGTGNIKLNGAADFAMNNAADVIELEYHSPVAAWIEIARSNNT